MTRKGKTTLLLTIVVIILVLVMHRNFFETVGMDNRKTSQDKWKVNNSPVNFEKKDTGSTEKVYTGKKVFRHLIRQGSAIQEYRRIQSQNNSFATGYNDPRVPSFIEDMPPDDKRLVDVLRKIWIEPPSTQPYNLTGPPELRAQFSQDNLVDKLLNHKVSMVGDFGLTTCISTPQPKVRLFFRALWFRGNYANLVSRQSLAIETFCLLLYILIEDSFLEV